ncbi:MULTISPECIES: alpha/beta hydrolase domain-containing protein [unclassified Nocardiopsis]|uniref:alpha/beta hydrolase domain-containing protein n=1 Tax=unclassified Nocardiopsis TaxID=2649073 RepID=UPI00135AF462|nr:MULTISPECIES: alpha/beta hydrolase domain-containing protein [unclassified Nocardiopsis]
MRTSTPLRLGAVATGLAVLPGLLGTVPALAEPADVPAATVSGPVPVTDDSYPFMSADGPEAPPIEAGVPIEVDLGAHGYVEEEFLLEGTAEHRDPATGEVTGSSPYTTRMVVRRPARTRDFSGTAFLEWNNVSFGQDIEIDWFLSHDYLMREGHVWVGLSAQRVGVDALRAWDPERYGGLTVGGRELADAPAFDIYSQTARALRSPEGVDPLPGLDVDTVIATGHSQSARYLSAYHNTVHPHHGVVDGFVIHGAPTALEEGTTPVMRVLAETDVRLRSQSQEPDSAYFRRWEVAGTAHVGYTEYLTFAPLIARENPGTRPQRCDRPPFSRIPFHHVLNAAYEHMVDWVEDGTAPPRAPRLAWEDAATARRDEHGNRLGGIRLPEHEVATALNHGDNTGDPFCVLQGTHVPFDEETLQELYPRRGGYVWQVNRAVNRARHDGYLLAEDARDSRKDALRTSYPWW